MANSPLWPINGITYFMSRPKLWIGPLFNTMLAWIASIVCASFILWYFWPSNPELSFWGQCIQSLAAFAYACIGFVALWMFGIPFLLSFAFERLMLKVLEAEKIEAAEAESTIKAALTSTTIFIRGLPWRILWFISALLCSFIFPPLAIILSALGLGHSCLLDSCEMVLAATGKDGKYRKKFYKQHRMHLLSAAAVAGAASAALSFTFIGLLFWLPGVLCAAAITIPHWTIDDPSE